jgi:nitrogenase iron protein NifH
MSVSIAIYGKGGSGKSTLAAGLSYRFATLGLRVLHLGCDPKADSSRLLVRGEPIRSVMGTAMRTDLFDARSLLMRGVAGITCVEAGGPEPGVGCAGRGITRTFELLAEAGVDLEAFDAQVYDVLGDVVCGGFATPLKDGHARQVVVVASGSAMSLFAANNIFKAVRRFQRNGIWLAGLLGNYHTGEGMRDRLARFAQATGARLLGEIPFDAQVQVAEERRKTICEHAPAGPTARQISQLAEALIAQAPEPEPRPLDEQAFEAFLASWSGGPP